MQTDARPTGDRFQASIHFQLTPTGACAQPRRVRGEMNIASALAGGVFLSRDVTDAQTPR